LQVIYNIVFFDYQIIIKIERREIVWRLKVLLRRIMPERKNPANDPVTFLLDPER